MDPTAIAIETVARLKRVPHIALAQRTKIDVNRVTRILRGLRRGTNAELEALARRGLGMSLESVERVHETICEALAEARQ